MFLGTKSKIKVETGGVECGVYVLSLDGKPVYVGQSKGLSGRIANHVGSNEMVFDDFDVFPCEPEHLNQLEAEMIVKYQTARNKTLPKNKRFVTKAAIKSSFEILLTKELGEMDECFSTIQRKYVDSPDLSKFLKRMISIGVQGAIEEAEGIKELNNEKLMEKTRKSNKKLKINLV